ncbi:DUF5067 domain-containing protein [Fructobacillus fructosus]|uniref:DUF5067 domain-containing protein n=1 Tax=Fructobacillus fructosus TaxID=1631 RepID=UPI0040343C70
MFKNKKTSYSIFGIMAVIIIALIAFLVTRGTNDSGKQTVNTSATKTSSKKSANSDSTNKDNQTSDWYLKGTTFRGGNLKFDLGKSEVVKDYDGNNAFVIHAKMTNVSNEEMDSSAMYMVVSAFQKTDTQNKKLDPAMVTDEPINTEAHNLSEKLLPGKTVDVAILWNTVNDNDVTVKFENSDFKELGTKTYSIK